MFGKFRKWPMKQAEIQTSRSAMPLDGQCSFAAYSSVEHTKAQLSDWNSHLYEIVHEFIFGYALGSAASIMRSLGNELSQKLIAYLIPFVSNEYRIRLKKEKFPTGVKLTDVEWAGAILGCAEPSNSGRYEGLRNALDQVRNDNDSDPFDRKSAIEEFCYKELASMSDSNIEEVKKIVEELHFRYLDSLNK